MEAAQAAYPGWSRDEAARRQALRACADVMRAAAAEEAPLLVREQGKPLAKAVGEWIGAGVWFQLTAGLEIPLEVVQDDEKARIEVRRRPFGVVAAITPWNFPVLLAVWKIAPALLAGNTVVIKPSPYTPLTTLRLGELLRDVLPPGVLNVVSGGDALGAWISQHPIVRKMSFTGSVATGKQRRGRGGAGPEARDARARRQRRGDRARRRRPRAHRRQALLGRLREQRPGVQRDQARLRARGSARGAASTRWRSGPAR